MPLYEFEGHRPSVPADGRYWVAPDAHVIGKVRLGSNVSIWFGAVLRGDNEEIVIGDNSNLQESVVVHTDPGFRLIVGSGCTIGHRAILHGCQIADNTLIGMGAVLLNGAKIGSNCLIGANALVTGGKVFPDNSLIMGSPAKVVREINEEERAGLQRAAAFYISKWQRFTRSLKRLD